MKALVIAKAEDKTIEAIQLIDRPVPDIQPDHVLVKVKAVGLNPVDVKLIEGGVSSWAFPHTMGLDVAGVVVKVGENVTAFQVGDRVSGHGNLFVDGCLAEFVVVPSYQLAHIPEAVNFEEAASFLCGAMTAYQAVFDKFSLRNRKTALIHAGAGGVGSVAIQLAKLAGLTVFTTVSSAKTAFVKNLGADVVIDYHNENLDDVIAKKTAGLGVDLIINTLDAESSQADLNRLAYNGALVSVVSGPKNVDCSALFRKGQGVALVNLGGAHGSNNPKEQRELGEIAQTLLNLLAEKKLSTQIYQCYALDDAKTALFDVKSGKHLGKVVIKMDAN